MFGCRCRIYLHSHVSEARERAIAIGSEGATDPETFERVVGRPWEEVRG